MNHSDEHTVDELLEASWTDRARRIEGRELRLELLLSALFAVAAAMLLVWLPPAAGPEPVAVLVVGAYAIAARTEFAVGAGHVVPTQIFLVVMFAVAPATLVPPLVFAGLAISVAGGAATGATRLDRLVYCGGDAIHALGPALVIGLLGHGTGLDAGPAVIALAFAAQLACDMGSSAVRDLLVFGVKPELHARVLAQVWASTAR